MRSLSAVALIASALSPAAASELSVADETALLQTKADPASESHLGMPQLRCDMSMGCRYEGLPERPSKPAAPMFPSFLAPVDPATLKKLVEGIKLPDMSKIQEELAKVKLPDFAQLAKDAAKLMPPAGAPPAFNLGKMMQGASKQAPPPAFQMPDLAKIMQGAAKLAPPAAPKPQQQQAPPAFQMPDLAKMIEGLSKLKPPAPGVSALQVSGDAVLESATAHFFPDNRMVCVQGPEEYVTKSLAKLRTSPLGAGYQAASVLQGSCADHEYADGPMPDKCLPQATIFMSKAHPMQPLSEPMLIAKYALKHGMEAVKQGMADLCKED